MGVGSGVEGACGVGCGSGVEGGGAVVMVKPK